MKRIVWTSGTSRRGPVGAVLGGLAGLMAAAVMAALVVVTLGIAFAFLRGRRRRRSFGFGPGGRMPRGVRGGRGAFGERRAPGPFGFGSEPPGSSEHSAPSSRERSRAEVVETLPIVFALALSLAAAGAMVPAPAAAKLLVPMDEKQTDHLRAYGLAYWVIAKGQKAEWLLNYRGGSFLFEDDGATAREANLRGVWVEPLAPAAEAQIRARIAEENMESVTLEKAPRVAVYIPPNTPPWDDAVTLALKYADIKYETVWDEAVLRGDLQKFDWLHLHHEDFTAQHGKFYAAYHSFPWYQEEERVQQAMAKKLGFAKVTQLKAAVAVSIKDFIGRGGFMFGMCSATDTYDIALAAQGVDIVDAVYDADPPETGAARKLDFSRTLAFKDFRLEMDPFLYRFSDIDVTQEASLRGPAASFALFEFSAKNDPVPTMLVQNHVAAVPEFLGQSTGFRRPRMKSGVLVLGEVEGTDEVKYLHGQFGRGTFTFLGGHDPEDYQHMVGDPPTDLVKFKHSPGYRLILNNVLFPAAEKKKQRT